MELDGVDGVGGGPEGGEGVLAHHLVSCPALEVVPAREVPGPDKPAAVTAVQELVEGQEARDVVFVALEQLWTREGRTRMKEEGREESDEERRD